MIAAGVARVVVGARDPNPKAAGGIERLRAAGVEVELLDSLGRARQNEAWRTWKSLGRPFVTYKVAVIARRPRHRAGRRWVSGEESRRRVHELRAALGRGRGRHGHGARRRPAARRARRRRRAAAAAARLRPRPAPELELRSGPLEDELRALAAEGVQSLLLEGGPTLATAFLRAGLVDKLLLFVAPVLSGDGPRFLGDLADAGRALARHRRGAIGDDVLIEAYVREP